MFVAINLSFTHSDACDTLHLLIPQHTLLLNTHTHSEKNVKNVLLWNLLDSAGGALGYWATGYAFSYGELVYVSVCCTS